MIDRIHGRDAFQRLAREGTRIRRPALWCTWCPDPNASTTSVAFSLNRGLGPAVVRNRVRRRLRAQLRRHVTRLPPGTLLIGVRPAAIELTFDQLETELLDLMARLRPDASRR